MRDFIRVVVSLAFLSEIKGEAPHRGYCVDKDCYTVFQDEADFSAARKVCADNKGHLMTVRTTVSNDAIASILLSGLPGDFWIGLQFAGEKCTDTSSDLKGYTWVTGDNATDFHNWKSTESVCSPHCVTVSKDDPKWTEKPCDVHMAGFLCERELQGPTCAQLPVESDETVLYKTSLEFEVVDPISLPEGSTGREPSGKKYICFNGNWMPAPWSCEVFKGGCEHECVKLGDQPTCTCPPGFMLESNGVSCAKTANDPCFNAGCKQMCIRGNGSFTCMCSHGYDLDEDKKSCKDIDDCADDRLCPDQNSECVNTLGGFDCMCKSGYEKKQGTCEDVDECASGPCEHTCNNTQGSYHCNCFEGFILNKEHGHDCKLHCPHKECLAVDCDPNNQHQCSCPQGFILDKRQTASFCVDINECEMFYCQQGCENTYGSYVCSCDEGYDLVGGYKCVEKDLTEGSGSPTPYDFITPTVQSTTESPSTVTAGGLLGIIICIVVAILVMVCLVHHILKRRGKLSVPSAHKSRGEDIHSLQQVTTENYTKKGSFSNRHLKQETIQ